MEIGQVGSAARALRPTLQQIEKTMSIKEIHTRAPNTTYASGRSTKVYPYYEHLNLMVLEFRIDYVQFAETDFDRAVFHAQYPNVLLLPRVAQVDF